MTHAAAALTIWDENAYAIARILDVLSLAQPGIDWYGELAETAIAWQPFIDRGLSIEAWLLSVQAEL
jgi:hypothetical protein